MNYFLMDRARKEKRKMGKEKQNPDHQQMKRWIEEKRENHKNSTN